MFANLVRYARALTTLLFLNLAGPPLHAGTVFEACEPLLQAHARDASFVKAVYINPILDQRSRATVLARIEFRSADQTRPLPDAFKYLNVAENEAVGVIAGAREDVVRTVAQLVKAHGKHVKFQVVFGDAIGEPFTVPDANKRITFKSDLAHLERALTDAEFTSLIIDDQWSARSATALPASTLRTLDDATLNALGIAVHEDGVAGWAARGRVWHGLAPAMIFRGPGYVIATEKAFRKLGKLAGIDVEARALNLPAELASAFAACAAAPCEDQEPLPLHLTDGLEIFAALAKLTKGTVDWRTPDALAKVLTDLWTRHVPGETPDLAKIKPLDGAQLDFEYTSPPKQAAARLANAWAILGRRIAERAIVTTPPEEATPAETRKTLTLRPVLRPKPDPRPADQPIKKVVAPEALVNFGERMDDDAAVKTYAILAKYGKWFGPSNPGGVQRCFLDILRNIAPAVPAFEMRHAKQDLLAINITKNNYASFVNQERKARAVADLTKAWRVIQRLTKDPAAEQPVTIETLAASERRLNEIVTTGKIKAPVIPRRRPGGELRLPESIRQHLLGYGMTAEEVRLMIDGWHGLRDGDVTVLIPPESAVRARREGGIVTDLDGDRIVGVRRNAKIELEFFGRVARSQQLMLRTLKVTLANQQVETLIKVPPAVQAQLPFYDVSLTTIRKAMNSPLSTPIPTSDATSCFEYREFKGKRAYEACFADWNSVEGATLLKFTPRSLAN